ncbi:hypothetical protein LXA43DRAFT_504797 [Ganoderma leucocontextum]|nr:hypothetical protein LXA43DRAFT_504797 [Ganoderma leucocontextum]
MSHFFNTHHSPHPHSLSPSPSSSRTIDIDGHEHLHIKNGNTRLRGRIYVNSGWARISKVEEHPGEEEEAWVAGTDSSTVPPGSRAHSATAWVSTVFVCELSFGMESAAVGGVRRMPRDGSSSASTASPLTNLSSSAFVSQGSPVSFPTRVAPILVLPIASRLAASKTRPMFAVSHAFLVRSLPQPVSSRVPVAAFRVLCSSISLPLPLLYLVV